MKKSRNYAMLLVASTAFAGSVQAAVSADEAKQLGGATLTVLGAEKAGNKEGTIPPYAGAGVKPPANYDPKNPGVRPDPYGEKPLFSITAQNAAQYADKLGPANMELFKRYPNYRVDVYPTHRDFFVPKFVLDNTVKNATSCKAVAGELNLEGCYGGRPFPIPKTGAEAMWNHSLHYEAFNEKMINDSWLVPTSGSPVLNASLNINHQFPIFNPALSGTISGNYQQTRINFFAPNRKAGEALVYHQTIDMRLPARVWQYIPGQRRVKMAPDLAFDTPSPFGGGAQNQDDNQVFGGSLERYDWKLVGKKEMFIPNNNYKLTTCSAEHYLTKYFPNPDCLRWELHRVWMVEGSLKPGFRHIYPKRTLYWDEDSFGDGMAENYDAAGKLYRYNLSYSVPVYDKPGAINGPSLTIDLQTGVWTASGMAPCPTCGVWPVNESPDPRTFSPEDMAGSGIR